MRTLVVLAAAAALLAACSGEQPTAESSNTTEPSSPAVELPPDPEPAVEGPCPYLETDLVSRANGQRVARVRISNDDPYPACFFYRPDGGLQLTVRVYVGEPGIATALVDKAAPVDTSNPTEQPPGWEGGYESTDKGAVYAVSKGDTAVIVSTNQQQSVKARSVATEAISALGT
ncbi:protein of unknown function (DUF2020) [Saccharomonospora marina XMU15]|uniref:DUF2020 domain-containing protein n=1 Tax=Saccharomonospora marina XMU15 TaxID=882083 RepID=H5WZA2_9PSEU|nr:DUF2020 domain-containing protein [Saccharomonospora marina]EHR48505.1 protein of unknown function (DUF2020) [Saccharomonospora marina XMU15]